MPYNVSNAAQLRGNQSPRDSAVSDSETYPQLELVRVACCQLLQVLGSPYNVSNAAPLVELQVTRNPSISETCPQLEFVWVAFHLLQEIYSSLLGEAIQLGEHQVHRDLEISDMFPLVMERVTSRRPNLLTLARQVALAARHLEFVLAACYQLLQAYGILPGEYNATQLGEHQVQADNGSQIQPPVLETTQPTDAQEAAGGVTSGKLHCFYEGCEVTFGRPQERKRHVIGAHLPRRRCALCLHEWYRPDKIKSHLMETHQDELPQEVLNGIHAKCGQDLVAFLEHRSVVL
ncbi:hypothetical protein EDB85DRAFT_356220 [Lactarius pseudohatsudake]|nr:hypothetical protein EDB85DRAFT_356220 [Lactarius pseudohatsudake]